MPIGSTNKQRIRLSQDPEKQLYVDGFSGGLNSLVSPQHIQDNECSILLNAQISEDGVISRRAGSTQYDATDGSRVYGLGMYTSYDNTGTPARTLLKMDDSGNLRKYNFTTKAWSTIGGYTYSTGYNTQFVPGITSATTNPVMYILNGKDPMSRTDSSTITTFTKVTDPSGGLTVAAQGSTGSSTYVYEYTLVTKYGETLPCSAVTITNGNATLTSSNYNLLTITRSSDSNVIGYNVYGRENNLTYYLNFVPQSASGNPTYSDTGKDTPNIANAPPTVNATNGHVVSMGTYYHDIFMCAGDPNFTSYLYWSSTGNFDDFSLTNGGGFQLVAPEDGDKITAVVSFKDKIAVFKNRSTYLFEFSGTQPVLSIVNPFIGCAATRSAKVVVNDIYFLSPSGNVFTLGYQEGYYGIGGVADMLRVNPLSVKISPTLSSINTSKIANAAAIYSVPNYKYILAYADGSSSYNNKMVVFDTRYQAWVQWDNMDANCFLTFIDSTNTEQTIYGDDNAGKVIQMFSGSSDQGNSFTFRMRTKDFNGGAFHLLKTWIWPTIHFRNISGSVTTTLTADGANTVYSNTITSTTSYSGWGYDRWANYNWATTAGNAASATAADAPRQINTRVDSRSLMYLFENTSTSDSITILGVESRYLTRVGRRLPSTYIIN